MFQFYKKVFDLWLRDKNEPILRINPFSNIISGFWYGRINDCTYLGNCHNYFSIETDGSVYPCGRFNHSKDFLLGNILINDWSDILQSEVLMKFTNRNQKIKDSCKSCKWLKLCWGGCSASSYLFYESLESPTPWCNVRKKLFDYIYNSIINLKKEAQNEILS